MLSLLAQVYTGVHHYGFLGIDGLLGLVIGIVIFVCLAAILFNLFKALMAAAGVPAPWSVVLYWLVVLVIFLIFLHFFGLY